MAYATVDEVKAQLEADTLPAVGDDDVLGDDIAAATKLINGYCNRPDGFEADAVASARIFTGLGKSYLYLPEFVDVTLVAVKDSVTETTYTSWEDDDYVAFAGDPLNPNFQPLTYGRPYQGIMVSAVGDAPFTTFYRGSYNGQYLPTVQVTAKWGYSVAVPDDIHLATVMTVAYWYKRLKAHMADALGNPETGEIKYIKGLDPSAQAILDRGRYKRPAIGTVR